MLFRSTALVDAVSQNIGSTAAVWSTGSRSVKGVLFETDVDEAARILSSGYSAILVSEHGMMVGIVTKIDLIASHSM